MSYYYTPLFDGEYFQPDPETEELVSAGTTREPGTDSGNGAEKMDMPSGLSVLKYDDTTSRCIVKTNVAQTIAGWAEKTKEEVLSDYPELSGRA